MSDSPPRGVVALLTAQGFAFGVTLALLLVPANSIFLDAYGSEWLPATYVAIAVIGSAASAFIVRAARRTRLVGLATVTLGAFAALFALSWPILAAGGVWVSAVLLVVFPIALQVGFVFIGGQAGRLLDIRQMKGLFPRIVSGFAVGFLVGGLLGIPLLALLGSTEHLLLATTVAQLAFLGLLVETERRFPEVRVVASDDAPTVARPPLRMLFASGIALLLLVYQVLSAMGSWVVDFLFFDRASARYSGNDLTEFLSAYTALVNLVDILFLALLAGALMRRFGLRLGLLLNPALVSCILALMLVVAAGAGTAAFGLFVLAGFLRVADIATTDGTTRTSINAAYQVVPVEERLAVQAVVEGIGVPVAIGVTGVLLLALNLLGFGTAGVIVFGLVLGVIWTVAAVSAYRSYTHSLADEMRRRSVSSIELDVADDDAAAVHALLRSEDARDVRLGLELLAGVASPGPDAELRQIAEHADPEMRMKALALLAAHGDEQAATDAAAMMRELLVDSDPAARAAGLDAVAPSDSSDPELVRRVVSALDDPDRAVVLRALEALAAADGRDLVPPGVLDGVIVDATSLAARARAARADLSDVDGSLLRALDDEIDLARRLVIAALTVRHGDRLRDAVRVIDHAEGARGALGVEALDVLLTRTELAAVLPLIRREAASDADRKPARRPDEWIADIADDPEGVWRSEWLATCARHVVA